MEHTGGCLCGQVRYVATGEPENVRVCHCRLCQRATGQPFNARALYRLSALAITGELARYPSSDTLDRGFCPRCGTTLFSLRDAAGIAGVTLGTFDAPDALSPTSHIWVSTKQPWVCIEAGAEVYPEAIPA